MKKLKWILAGIIAVGLAAVLWIIMTVQSPPSGTIILPDAGLRSEAVMVLGASVKSDGTPSDALRDRLLVGIQLYQNHNADRILLTGDDGAYHADEIDVMKSFTVNKGVPVQDILTDGQGYRTYESCKHAAQTFHLHNILVVTQRFHIARALYLCDHFGLSAFGVTSDLESYKDIVYFWARDLAASVEAWWDTNIWSPKPPVG